MAAPQWVLVAHVLLTLFVVISFLCGQWPIFHGTIVERIHNFLTFGAYDYFLRFVVIIFGSKGKNIFLSIEHYCCERPNPILQTVYLAIIGVTYFIIVKSSFIYIPGYYITGMHRYTSIVMVVVGVLLFLVTSFSDPGTVKPENVSQYLAAYPYDNIIYKEKQCPTCKIPKPARSKHCSICDRCVARFDHHCGWMNNCIGEMNTRYFMAFLIWHFFICLYGTIILALILAGQLEEKRIIYILTVYYGIDNSFYSLFPHVAPWLLNEHNTQILLLVFLALVSLLLAGFFGYHARLCLINTTTNETFKWQDYISWKMRVNEAKATSAALKAGVREGKDVMVKDSKGKKLRDGKDNTEVIVKKNIYDGGFFHNIYEIVSPLSRRSSFVRRKSE